MYLSFVNGYRTSIKQYNSCMKNPLTWLSRKRHPYEPLIKIYLSEERLRNNFREFQKIAPRGNVAPVLKSNAYGHGFKEIAQILKSERNIPFFVVDSYFEAIALSRAGVKSQILIIGYTRPETILNSRLKNAVFCISSLESLEKISGVEHPLPIHLKIDTGMHRQGIQVDEISKAGEIIESNPCIDIQGICTHLCDADNPDPSYTESQINEWNRCARTFKKRFPKIRYVHASATDAHRYGNSLCANVSRLGLGLYGLSQTNFTGVSLNLKPVLSMQSVITDVKWLERGEKVGYGASFTASNRMKIAIVPVGYFEGVDRRLSNKGFLMIQNSEISCPIIGRVSMNITIIDVTKVYSLKIGSPVSVISCEAKDPNSIISMARLAETIPYDIACHIPAHLVREIMPCKKDKLRSANSPGGLRN